MDQCMHATNYRNRLMELCFTVVDNLNKQLPRDQQIVKSPDTILIGHESSFDSLRLVNFTLAIEQSVNDEFNVTISLTDSEFLSPDNSHFRTIGSLADYIVNFLEKLQAHD